MSDRVAPYHCPYCGNEDLRPHETETGSAHGTWECRACLRAFKLSFLGLLRPSPVVEEPSKLSPSSVVEERTK